MKMQKRQKRSIRIEKRGRRHYEIIKDMGDGVVFSVGHARNLMDAKLIKKQNLWGDKQRKYDLFIPIVKDILTNRIVKRGRDCKSYDEAVTVANNMKFDSFNEYLTILEEKR